MKSNIIKPNDLVKVKKVNNHIILHNITNCNRKASIKRISGNRHINLSTGEIVENKKTLIRGESMRSLFESNLRLQDLIKENTIDIQKLLLITLTYREKILDTKKVNEDFKVFIKYLRKHFTDYGEIEYINTLEKKDENSGFHIHAILFFNKSTRSVFLPVQTLNDAWKNGYTSVGKPKGKQEVYFYLTPHLSKEVNEKNSHMHNKALMQMQLPAGVNLYHHSKGIKKPTIYTDTYENVKKYLNENSYIYESEQVYKNPMQTYRGNNLYYCKEKYIKAEEQPKEPDSKPRKRTPI